MKTPSQFRALGSRLAVLGCLAVAAPAAARDYGQHGAVFPIAETDLLLAIEQRLRSMEASGEIARRNREWADRTAELVRRPPPVSGISRAIATRSWTHDPSITTREDIRDHRGRLLFAKGTRVNPLDTVRMRQRLLFLNGDDPEQVSWALATTTPENGVLILTSGNVFDRMKAAQRQFFFDQGGKLTTRFGIEHVPALVQQDGRLLRVTELSAADMRQPQTRRKDG